MQALLHFTTLITVAIAAMSFATADTGVPALLRLAVLLIGAGGSWLSLARLVIQQRAR